MAESLWDRMRGFLRNRGAYAPDPTLDPYARALPLPPRDAAPPDDTLAVEGLTTMIEYVMPSEYGGDERWAVEVHTDPITGARHLVSAHFWAEYEGWLNLWPDVNDAPPEHALRAALRA